MSKDVADAINSIEQADLLLQQCKNASTPEEKAKLENLFDETLQAIVVSLKRSKEDTTP